MALNVAHVSQQRFGQRVAIREARKARELLEPVSIRRQRMGLLVRDHLQAVLNDAQKAVSRDQIVARPAIDPSAAGQRIERLQGRPRAQLRMASAGNELLRLYEKLDLADTATAELDVMPFDRDLVVTAIDVDLPLHRVDVGNRREVEVFAPHEGR